MPVEHIVLLKWKPDLSPARIEQQLAGVFELRTRVPDLTSLQAGKPFKIMPDNVEWDCAIVMTFPTRKAFDHWATCDNHTQYAKELLPDVDEFLVVDFER